MASVRAPSLSGQIRHTVAATVHRMRMQGSAYGTVSVTDRNLPPCMQAPHTWVAYVSHREPQETLARSLAHRPDLSQAARVPVRQAGGQHSLRERASAVSCQVRAHCVCVCVCVSVCACARACVLYATSQSFSGFGHWQAEFSADLRLYTYLTQYSIIQQKFS